MNEMNSLPWWAWLLIVPLLATQGTLLFLDSRKRGANPWVWGLAGLVQFPVPSLLYWIFVIRKKREPR